MEAWDVILAFQCFFTFALTGLAWCVQLLVYPVFSWIDRDRFHEFEKNHQKKVVWLAAPLMAFECFFTLLLLKVAKSGEPRILCFVLFFLLLVIWFSTCCLQMPTLVALSKEFHSKHLKKLIVTNWIRTVSWTLRSLLLIWLLLRF